MKKLILSLSVVVLFIIYSSFKQSQGSTAIASSLPTAVPNSKKNAPTPAPSDTPPPADSTGNNQPTSIPPTSAPPTSAPSGQYRDGTYTGDSVDVFYGFIQVQATVQNGKITDVKFLQYPNDRSTSVMINTQAMPMLQAQAIQAQSANVDGVSGATDSSQGFIASLGSALAKAK